MTMTKTEESLTQRLVWSVQKYEQLITELVEAHQVDDEDKIDEVMEKITDHVAEVKAIITAHTHHLLADPVDIEAPRIR
jgi:hypothetical protein